MRDDFLGGRHWLIELVAEWGFLLDTLLIELAFIVVAQIYKLLLTCQ